MKNKSDLIFKNYIVNKVVFDYNESCVDKTVDINAEFSYRIKHDEKNKNISFVSLCADVFKNAAEEKYPFELSIELTGEFEAENIDSFHGNCLAILFPYLRAIISTYTAAANVSPLILPAINILKMLENEKEISEEVEN